jgi:hypothetical protein
MIVDHRYCPVRPDVVEDRGAGTGMYCTVCGAPIRRADTTGEMWAVSDVDDESLAPAVWIVCGVALMVVAAVFALWWA